MQTNSFAISCPAKYTSELSPSQLIYGRKLFTASENKTDHYVISFCRIRRIEIAQIMEECQLLASQLSDIIQFEYLPRECNCLADYFAGFASAFLLSQPLDVTTTLTAPLPYSLLSKHGFKVDHTEADK